MSCTSGLISSCRLLTWVKAKPTTSCSSEVTSCLDLNQFGPTCDDPVRLLTASPCDSLLIQIRNSSSSSRCLLGPRGGSGLTLLSSTMQQPQEEQRSVRSAGPNQLTAAVGPRVLSQLDDGTGCSSPERLIALWTEEGIRNSRDILQVSSAPRPGTKLDTDPGRDQELGLDPEPEPVLILLPSLGLGVPPGGAPEPG